ncbi:MAG: PEP-utilizing enzyme [Nanoarchaeota archaeon]
MGDPLAEAKDVQWEWIMKKPFCVLRIHLDINGNAFIPKKWKIQHQIKHEKFIDNHIYIAKSDIEQVANEIKEKADQNISYAIEIKDRVQLEIKDIIQFTEKIKHQDLADSDDDELIHLFQDAYERLGIFSAYLSVRGPVPLYDALSATFLERLRRILAAFGKEEMTQEYFLALSTPEKESFMTEEKIELLRLAVRINGDPHAKRALLEARMDDIKKEQVFKDILDHKNRYDWMNCVMFYGLPYPIEHYIRELSRMLEGDPDKEMLAYTEQSRKMRMKQGTILQEIKLGKEDALLLHEIKEWGFLRTYIKDTLSIAIYNVYPLLEEIAKRKHLRIDDIIYLTFPELQKISEKDETELKKTIDERKKGFGALLVGKKLTLFTDDRYRLEEKENIDAQLVEVFGQTASLGEAKGKARVIHDIGKEMHTIQKGEIIVTHMTTTDYTPILDIISGIVTDEGGLTCHAAIVSRELGIPCVIGTKIATKVFKTGDHILLDAKRGSVKKLPKYEPGHLID